MIRIWAKIIKDNKMQENIIYENYVQLTDITFYEAMVEICHKLDISVPVIIRKHIANLQEFNMVKFFPRDFIEKVEFDYMLIENALL